MSVNRNFRASGLVKKIPTCWIGLSTCCPEHPKPAAGKLYPEGTTLKAIQVTNNWTQSTRAGYSQAALPQCMEAPDSPDPGLPVRQIPSHVFQPRSPRNPWQGLYSLVVLAKGNPKQSGKPSNIFIHLHIIVWYSYTPRRSTHSTP